MRILAIETSGEAGSLATLSVEMDAAWLLRQTLLPADQRTAQSIAPRLQDLLAEVGWKPRSIELVAVAVGPGSFTGLRIGVTAAKTLAYATGADVIGVNTLAVVAAQAPASSAPLWTVMDAQRSELFVAKFEFSDKGSWQMAVGTAITPQREWLEKLRPGDRITGPAMRRMLPRLPPDITVVAEELWQPVAATVGLVGWRDYLAGRRDDVWKLLPQYYRLSAAEEKAARTKQESGGGGGR